MRWCGELDAYGAVHYLRRELPRWTASPEPAWAGVATSPADVDWLAGFRLRYLELARSEA
jgi:hypothetical protein